jgi:hypothetical protein
MNALDCERKAVFTELIEVIRAATDADPLAIAPVHGAIPGVDAADPTATHCAWAADAQNNTSASAAIPAAACVLHALACPPTRSGQIRLSRLTPARYAYRATPPIAPASKLNNCDYETTMPIQDIES